METTNHEYYVSLEVAKLLKEAGFDWKCACYYTGINDKIHIPNNGVIGFMKKYEELFRNHNETISPIYSAPTLDVAQRWLREVKGFEVTIDWSVIVNFKLVDFNGRAYNYHVESDDYADGDNELTSYEQAQEAGIKEALELILEKGE